MPRILVVDQDRKVLHSIRQAFSKTGIQVATARTADRGIALMRQRPPDLLLLDAGLAEHGIWAAVHEPAGQARSPLVAALVAKGAARPIIEAVKRGAFDVFEKPLDYGSLRELMGRTLGSPSTAGPPPQLPPDLPFIAVGAAMHEVVRDVGRAASRDAAVLLSGESGTGKTHLARVIHHYGPRAGGPYAEFTLAGWPVDRLERELFGYERGAFREAYARRLGRLERCQGGAVLLDEIDALPPQTQSRLKSALEEQCLRRLGGDEPLLINLRVLAATRKDIERLVSDGLFRRDLYHNLRDVFIALPPLRERLDELPQLAAWFLVRSIERNAAAPVPSIAEETLDLLRGHSWPGNLWELESVLRQAAWRCRRSVILPDDLPEPFRPVRPASARGVDLPDQSMSALDAYLREALTADARQLYPECVALFDRYICGRVMQHTGGNQSRAARILGMTRRSLRTKIRRFDEAR